MTEEEMDDFVQDFAENIIGKFEEKGIRPLVAIEILSTAIGIAMINGADGAKLTEEHYAVVLEMIKLTCEELENEDAL